MTSPSMARQILGTRSQWGLDNLSCHLELLEACMNVLLFENPSSTKTLLLNSSVTGIIKLYKYHNQLSITLKCIEGNKHSFAATAVGKEGQREHDLRGRQAGSCAHPCTLTGNSSNRFQTVGHYDVNPRNKGGRKREKGCGKWHFNF